MTKENDDGLSTWLNAAVGTHADRRRADLDTAACESLVSTLQLALTQNNRIEEEEERPRAISNNEFHFLALIPTPVRGEAPAMIETAANYWELNGFSGWSTSPSLSPSPAPSPKRKKVKRIARSLKNGRNVRLIRFQLARSAARRARPSNANHKRRRSS